MTLIRWHLLVLLILQFSAIPLLQAESPDRPSLKSYGKTVTVNSPIVVRSGEVFDGEISRDKWTRYKAGKGMGDGSQKEDQRALFILEPGARLQHVIIDQPAADGIHVRTSDGYITTVRRVQFRDVGEDAITVESGDNDAYVLIEESVFLDARDKVIQINSKARVLIENCYAENFSIFARTDGGSKSSNFRVQINGLVARNGGTIVKSSSPNTHVQLMNLNLRGIDALAKMPQGATLHRFRLEGSSPYSSTRREEDSSEEKAKLILRILNGLSNLE